MFYKSSQTFNVKGGLWKTKHSTWLFSTGYNLRPEKGRGIIPFNWNFL